jgi:hypothetical protein
LLKMFFFWNQKCSLFEKNVLFSGIVLEKEHF